MSKFCKFEGKIGEVTSSGVPNRITCPECKRRFKPCLKHCGCGFDCACYIDILIPRHKIKAWWKKGKNE